MQDAIEFFGKSLDEAISEACAYYNVPRERLEIDIISNAKSGIFGLVGARKACVRARRTQNITLEDTPVFETKAEKPQKPEQEQTKKVAVPINSKKKAQPAAQSPEKSSSVKAVQEVAASANLEPVQKTVPAAVSMPRQRNNKSAQEPVLDGITDLAEDVENQDALPHKPLTAFDPIELERVAQEIVGTLVRPILQDEEAMECVVSIQEDKLKVAISGGESVALLIGREGQTLASVQYLAARLLSRHFGCIIRLHLDAGDYYERQEERLHGIALFLAERARATEKVQSTRPLSSYHRRIIHMALQDDATVHTRSKGEGSLKRVLVFPSRK